jgi:hypothetical protein
MTHLRLHETPNLGVHQTGSSSYLEQQAELMFDINLEMMTIFLRGRDYPDEEEPAVTGTT